jgi:hypothetical protein
MGYLRLIRSHASTQNNQMEQAGLEALLATMQGVLEVTLREQHPKGCYRVACSIEKSSFDRVIAAPEAYGWMSAI